MLLVAAGMVAHSLRYRSQTVTGLAFMLGFVTLLTSHLESADGTVVFSLSASVVLAVALVIVTAQRHWAWLELAGLIAVYLCHLTWLTQVPVSYTHLLQHRLDFHLEFAGLLVCTRSYLIESQMSHVHRQNPIASSPRLTSLSGSMKTRPLFVQNAQ